MAEPQHPVDPAHGQDAGPALGPAIADQADPWPVAFASIAAGGGLTLGGAWLTAHWDHEGGALPGVPMMLGGVALAAWRLHLALEGRAMRLVPGWRIGRLLDFILLGLIVAVALFGGVWLQVLDAGAIPDRLGFVMMLAGFVGVFRWLQLYFDRGDAAQ